MMVSIILPVYNCSADLLKGLEHLQPLLQQQSNCYEIIIADDGSADGETVKSIAGQYGCRLLWNPLNQGKGAAVKKGVLAATGDLILFMDGDFPFHLSAISEMVSLLVKPETHVVIGDRTHVRSKYPKNIKLFRKLGSKVLSFIISNFYIYGFKDTQCGIKGFKANIAKALFEKVTIKGFAFDVELLFIAKTNGFKIDQLPVVVNEQDRTTVKLVKDGLLMLFNLLKLFINQVAGKYKIDE